MKQVFAYYLLLLYAVALCKPVLPFVSDFLAHTFSPVQHRSVVHRHSGEAHAHKEAARAAAQSQSDEKSNDIRCAAPVSVHLVWQQPVLCFTAAKESKPRFLTFSPELSQPYLQVIAPPPKDCRLIG